LRIRGMTGDLLDLNDIAILLRSATLSRLIESALGKAGIAYRMVGKFVSVV
jgi:DNA helicase-2/ATP-dependent DNA helicase PcrA